MFCYSTIIDRKNNISSCKSHEFTLPEFHNKIISINKYLGEYVKDYFPKNFSGPKKYIREMI